MIELRPPLADELTAASDLCLRSKGFWGYDAAFLRACLPELALTIEDIYANPTVVAQKCGTILGVAQVSDDGTASHLEKLFVDPDHMGKGLGRRLFDWAVFEACEIGATRLIVEADPDAVPFYEALGCREAGQAPSGSIPGRVLPRLVLDLGIRDQAPSSSRSNR